MGVDEQNLRTCARVCRCGVSTRGNGQVSVTNPQWGQERTPTLATKTAWPLRSLTRLADQRKRPGVPASGQPCSKRQADRLTESDGL